MILIELDWPSFSFQKIPSDRKSLHEVLLRTEISFFESTRITKMVFRHI
jgi:hypothetical protein